MSEAKQNIPDDQLNVQSEGEERANTYKPGCGTLPHNSPVRLEGNRLREVK